MPKSGSIDLGVVDIFFDDYGQTIDIKGEGEKTVVGMNLPGATKGMSIPASSPLIIDDSSVRRARKPKKKRRQRTPSPSAGRA